MPASFLMLRTASVRPGIFTPCTGMKGWLEQRAIMPF
jgi:hypothetical protein